MRFLCPPPAAAWFMPAPKARLRLAGGASRNPSGRNTGILPFTFRAWITTSWAIESTREAWRGGRYGTQDEEGNRLCTITDSRISTPSASQRHNEGTYEVPQDGNSQSLETAAGGGPIRFSSEQFPAHVAISTRHGHYFGYHVDVSDTTHDFVGAGLY